MSSTRRPHSSFSSSRQRGSASRLSAPRSSARRSAARRSPRRSSAARSRSSSARRRLVKFPREFEHTGERVLAALHAAASAGETNCLPSVEEYTIANRVLADLNRRFAEQVLRNESAMASSLEKQINSVNGWLQSEAEAAMTPVGLAEAYADAFKQFCVAHTCLFRSIAEEHKDGVEPQLNRIQARTRRVDSLFRVLQSAYDQLAAYHDAVGTPPTRYARFRKTALSLQTLKSMLTSLSKFVYGWGTYIYATWALVHAASVVGVSFPNVYAIPPSIVAILCIAFLDPIVFNKTVGFLLKGSINLLVSKIIDFFLPAPLAGWARRLWNSRVVATLGVILRALFMVVFSEYLRRLTSVFCTAAFTLASTWGAYPTMFSEAYDLVAGVVGDSVDRFAQMLEAVGTYYVSPLLQMVANESALFWDSVLAHVASWARGPEFLRTGFQWISEWWAPAAPDAFRVALVARDGAALVQGSQGALAFLEQPAVYTTIAAEMGLPARAGASSAATLSGLTADERAAVLDEGAMEVARVLVYGTKELARETTARIGAQFAEGGEGRSVFRTAFAELGVLHAYEALEVAGKRTAGLLVAGFFLASTFFALVRAVCGYA